MKAIKVDEFGGTEVIPALFNYLAQNEHANKPNN